VEALRITPNKRDHDCARIRAIDKTLTLVGKAYDEAWFTAYSSLVAPSGARRLAELDATALAGVSDELRTLRSKAARELVRS
jgi:hypothetical protein